MAASNQHWVKLTIEASAFYNTQVRRADTVYAEEQCGTSRGRLAPFQTTNRLPGSRRSKPGSEDVKREQRTGRNLRRLLRLLPCPAVHWTNTYWLSSTVCNKIFTEGPHLGVPSLSSASRLLNTAYYQWLASGDLQQTHKNQLAGNVQLSCLILEAIRILNWICHRAMTQAIAMSSSAPPQVRKCGHPADLRCCTLIGWSEEQERVWQPRSLDQVCRCAKVGWPGSCTSVTEID